MPQFTVLLFYKYTHISHPQKLKLQQKALCESLQIKGRIILAEEGINATLAGTTNNIETYVAELKSTPTFQDIEIKSSTTNEQVFPKLSIKVRDEIVTLGQKSKGADVSLQNKAHYIEPEELLALYEKNKDFIILDARNQYEANMGKFKNALIPPIDNFREFPKFVNSISEHKDKEIVTYCTGGIRCEKASAYLREQGFKKVRQLHGGVHVYAEKTGGKYFEGELFVFDKRLQMKINSVNPVTIAQCEYCNTLITRYIDCANATCPELFNCCANCETQHSALCKTHYTQSYGSNSVETQTFEAGA